MTHKKYVEKQKREYIKKFEESASFVERVVSEMGSTIDEVADLARHCDSDAEMERYKSEVQICLCRLTDIRLYLDKTVAEFQRDALALSLLFNDEATRKRYYTLN